MFFQLKLGLDAKKILFNLKLCPHNLLRIYSIYEVYRSPWWSLRTEFKNQESIFVLELPVVDLKFGSHANFYSYIQLLRSVGLHQEQNIKYLRFKHLLLSVHGVQIRPRIDLSKGLRRLASQRNIEPANSKSRDVDVLGCSVYFLHLLNMS